MIEYRIFKDGKRRVVTFSYDDGHANDIPLIALLDKYGMKGTFNLNGRNYRTEEAILAARERYKNHEIACHTLQHGWPGKMPPQSAVIETIEDRKLLEAVAGYPVCGMAYPSNSYSDAAIAACVSCGIVYSRTTEATHGHAFPADWMKWHPSCHHRDAGKLVDNYVETLDSEWKNELFYIWGHSYEFDTPEKWNEFEEVLKKLAAHAGRIWFATNMEIYRYREAQKALVISADETTFYNPTATDVWVLRNKKDEIFVPAGQTVRA
ncbi:MAG: polysaccharide deacetylase family protein [Firmicutes bacterium]|nr:polysaccharide deacetylase family protein [Candidatus Colimorpha enterica]